MVHSLAPSEGRAGLSLRSTCCCAGGDRAGRTESRRLWVRALGNLVRLGVSAPEPFRAPGPRGGCWVFQTGLLPGGAK